MAKLYLHHLKNFYPPIIILVRQWPNEWICQQLNERLRSEHRPNMHIFCRQRIVTIRIHCTVLIGGGAGWRRRSGGATLFASSSSSSSSTMSILHLPIDHRPKSIVSRFARSGTVGVVVGRRAYIVSYQSRLDVTIAIDIQE